MLPLSGHWRLFPSLHHNWCRNAGLPRVARHTLCKIGLVSVPRFSSSLYMLSIRNTCYLFEYKNVLMALKNTTDSPVAFLPAIVVYLPILS